METCSCATSSRGGASEIAQRSRHPLGYHELSEGYSTTIFPAMKGCISQV
jgi:hypothetical protein